MQLQTKQKWILQKGLVHELIKTCLFFVALQLSRIPHIASASQGYQQTASVKTAYTVELFGQSEQKVSLMKLVVAIVPDFSTNDQNSKLHWY